VGNQTVRSAKSAVTEDCEATSTPLVLARSVTAPAEPLKFDNLPRLVVVVPSLITVTAASSLQ
jgi:hypothetical protein